MQNFLLRQYLLGFFGRATHHPSYQIFKVVKPHNNKVVGMLRTAFVHDYARDLVVSARGHGLSHELGDQSRKLLTVLYLD